MKASSGGAVPGFWFLVMGALAGGCAPAARIPAPVTAVVPSVDSAPPMVVEPVVDARTVIARTADSVFHDPKFRTAAWGALIVDPATGDTLYSLNPRKLVMP